MFQRRATLINIPWGLCDILRNMRVNFFPILVNFCRSSARFSCFFELLGLIKGRKQINEKINQNKINTIRMFRKMKGKLSDTLLWFDIFSSYIVDPPPIFNRIGEKYPARPYPIENSPLGTENDSTKGDVCEKLNQAIWDDYAG